MSEIPKDFELTPLPSPFLELVGPFYIKDHHGGFIIGVRTAKKHCNTRGFIHGGLISTLADFALGFNAARSGGTRMKVATINLTTDFSGVAELGDWLEAQVDVQKVGKSLAFANAYIYANGRRIARASGVYTLISD
jgi:acyl-coenzyme A thioesterase 13